MKAPAIPLRYRTKEPELAEDLQRMASEIKTWAETRPKETDALPTVAELNVLALAVGQIARISPKADEWVQLQLKQPKPQDGGRSLGVIRLSTLGAIELVGIGCTVNGYDRLLLLGDLRMNTISTDGVNYFMDNGGALNWGAGLL